MRSLRGITFRVALLGWAVTLVTLAVFVLVSVPQQEIEFRMNLESKALGVAASIKAVAAGAAVSEDYSAVVDQAMQVLAGDDAIAFVVITKNDGFSIVMDRANWRIETLDEAWRPAARTPVSTLGHVPLFGKRVFQYATPFDYSGIEWGWVHIGLSLEAYDQSVSRSYGRTLILSIICIALSLLVSLYYARRLVQPIHALHAAVERVAAGDLEATAEVRTSDEIGRLATAFNSMTATILARNRILEGVGFAAQELLRAVDWLAGMEDVLARLGKVTNSSRACLIEIATRDAAPVCLPRIEWTAPGASSGKQHWELFAWHGDADRARDGKRLANNEIVQIKRGAPDQPSSGVMVPCAQAMLAVPIVAGGSWWGLLVFEDCAHEREWGREEQESLRAVANMLGSTILRHRAQSALVEANNTLERRIIERTRELQEQVEARERAHAELAATQQRLVDMSRQAGMAEVATGVLHNVGNVLNSVNVAATLVLERIQQSKVSRIASVVGLLQQHDGDLGEFLRTDEKGSHIIPYLAKLSAHLVRERDGMLVELNNLSRHVGHIKEIVSAQQGYATTSGFLETVAIRKLMEDAIALSSDGLKRRGISVHLEVAGLKEVVTDKHKVLQIMLNLLRNAKDAAWDSLKSLKQIDVRVEQAGEDRFRITVADNGVGLTSEHLQRIFQHGFSTKKGGHGFGLHSGALAAKDLGGSLSVFSAGPDQGATFTLELPLNAPAAARSNPPLSSV
jgi:two-component system, NtrC family, sensor kinase